MNNELAILEAGIYNPPEYPEQTEPHNYEQSAIDYATLLAAQIEEMDKTERQAA